MDPVTVLDFWFGAPGSREAGQARTVWFRKDAAFDADIAARFGPAIATALTRPPGAPPAFGDAARAQLAEILLLDQFTRNVFRGTARAFAGDVRALALATALVDSGRDRELTPLQRVFAYLPCEHAEDLTEQDRAVALFTALAADAPATPALALASFVDYAHRHRDVIVRFGRFPHRNAALGRADTPEEAAYLAQPGAGF